MLFHLSFVADTTAVFASPFPRNQENRSDFSFAPANGHISSNSANARGRGCQKQHLLVVCVGWSRTRAGVRERERESGVGGIIAICEYRSEDLTASAEV